MNIKDNMGNTVLSSLQVDKSLVNQTTGFQSVIAESVVIYLDLTDPSRGDLRVELTSPDNVTSILAPSRRPETTQLSSKERWKLSTLKSWGTNPIGKWTLNIVDQSPGDQSSCVDLPWEFDASLQGGGNITISCSDFQNLQNPTQYCYSQDILSVKVDGRTIRDACCVCGGGESASSVPSVLHSWKMIIYGE